ncbi:MAG TPA: AMP-binding protein [Myxococcota bacterium]|jgi:fatty-acyl-CoA synthase/long-chain acyl-CoA synthetase
MSAPAANSASDLLALHAQAQPEKLAVIDDRADGTLTRWSYLELNRRANRLANQLSAAGVQPRDRVVWCGQNSPGVVAIIHAARKLGATAVPLNYRLTADEAAYIVDNCDAVLVWTDAEFAGLFAEIAPRCAKLRSVAVFGGPPRAGQLAGDAMLDSGDESEPKLAGVEATSMIYTSGTTGNPKGAVRGAGDPAQSLALLRHLGYRPDDVYLPTGPLYHSGPGGFMGVAFSLGQTIVLQRKFDAEDWLRLVEKYRVTSTFSAPTPIRLIVNLPEAVRAKYDRGSMRVMVANAAPWSFALKQAYLRDFPPSSLWEVYGSTELGVDCVLKPEDQLRKPGSCGQAAPGVELVLFDDDGARVDEPNKPGELFVRSKNVLSTYHKAHDKFLADTRGDYHTVGDVAYFDEEGFFYICDRKKDMIISGGMNVYPAEIESALDHHADVMDCAVFGIPSEEWGELVHAVVVARPGSGLTAEDVTEFARKQLAGYKVPRSISFVPELPRTGSGKILKRVLREPYWAGRKTRV